MDAIDDPPPQVCIRHSLDRRALDRPGLVLAAAGIDYTIGYDGTQLGLWVAAEDAQRAVQELDAYAAESSVRPPSRPAVVVIENGWPGVLAYLSIIWLLPSLEANGTFGWNWLDIGELDAAAVLDGQWWRTITALTLHANLGHLVANALFGTVFGLLVGRHLGSGLGWLLVLVCGALGNAIDASLQASDFRSIGASTATFASIGLLGAFVWRRGYYRTLDWRRSVAPIFAAIALLALTGIEGENIDIVAHLGGFAMGTIAGIVVAPFDLRRLPAFSQAICGTTSVALVAIAWWLAGVHA